MKVITITKEVRFEAAHRLVNHDGKCARLHGHSWVARVVFFGVGCHGHGPKENMLMDFGDIKAALTPLVDKYLDHHYLNETLGEDMPTSEFIAGWLFKQLEGYNWPSPLAKLIAVEVEETCTSSCRVEILLK